ncbi:MAG: hypothetical protein A2156_00665 [Deltaproteobacteria bacterium RBG_16_48_10]|nr:MAG: hypothetical protein A2156_00665 [Deltaproteobacteria bacterium RBG_16_48_10]
MAEKEFDLLELLKVDADPARVEELMELVEVDLPALHPEVKRHLLKQQVEMFNIEYGRYAAGTKITDELIEELMVDAIDTHAHGGSDPFERRQMEDEIAIDATRAKLKAIVIKTWYTPSASRNKLVQKMVDKWAEEHQMRPVQVFGGVTLNSSVGGLNPEAVMRCLGFPRFKYVWMPMSDAYYHQLIVFNRKDKGIKFLTDDGKVVPPLKEIFRIIADNDLILASGHYCYKETAILMEEAKKLGVKRMEIVHPTLIHSKHTLEEMREMGREGVKIGLMGIASVNVRFVEGIRWLFRVVKELNDYMVYCSDSGQIQNPTHIEGMKWIIRVLLAYGVTQEEVTKIFKTNPAAHLGIS